MLHNYLAAALRNLARNKVTAVINIIGLAAGFAAAILIALYVRYELTYDSFIPGHERVYRLSMIEEFTSSVPVVWDTADHGTAARLKADFPEVDLSARLVDGWFSVRHGTREFHEQVFTADPEFFRIVPVQTVAGDLATALDAPDGFVITRSMARKYFGKDAPVGETLEINRGIVLRVTAVIEDLPGNSHFNFALVGSGKAAFSSLSHYDKVEQQSGITWGAHTYFRLRDGASIERLQSELPAFVERHYQMPISPGGVRFVLHPLEEIHLAPAGRWPLKPPGSVEALVSLTIVAVLIVLVAAINFVNLMTARAAERSVEVGVRKVTGARRRDLILQFTGEALLYVLTAMLLSVALVELMLPALNAMLDYEESIYPAATITFPYWSDPLLAGSILGITIIVGLLAGTYPALVLSALRPVAALKRAGVSGGAAWIRQGLVILQFAILIGLIFATAVILRQTTFALSDALRIDKDQVLLIHSQYGAANEAFKQTLAGLPGVSGVTSSRAAPTNYDISSMSFQNATGTRVQLRFTSVDFNFFEFFGLEALAGRTFSRARGTDLTRRGVAGSHWSVVINEAAAHALGYANVGDAVGEPIRTPHWNDIEAPASITIVGVVPDFPVDSVRQPINPAMYFVDPSDLQIVSVRLTGSNIPETLESIDAVWGRLGAPMAISRWFLDQYYQRMYQDIIQQRELLTALCVIAVFLACLGLFGLSTFMAQRRTKEIGVRKALGAEGSDIMRLMLWSFSKPVLWANLIAWPIAVFTMLRWLNGFAYRVDLGWWLLPIASVAALAIALLTVGANSYLIARSKPVEALRYE